MELIIGNWIATSIIYRKRDTVIYNASLIRPVNSEYIYDINQDTKWVLKVVYEGRPHKSLEIQTIEELHLYDIPYSIKMPDHKKNRIGVISNGSWYAMEKYDDTLRHSVEFANNNFKLLCLNIIDLLEWFHIEKKVVHGDVKVDNILVNRSNTTRPFCLIDYELVDRPSNTICMHNLPNGYYYYGLGCDPHESYSSFRMDLQAFGYMLWSILVSNGVNNNKLKLFRFQIFAFEYYAKNTRQNILYELEIIKMNESLNKPPIIKQYFDIIENLPWVAKTAKPEIYTQLKELFNKN